MTLEQSKDLLSAVDGKNQERDYAILTLFLNCGLRISELVGLNLQDIQDETMRILGKGNKVRILYLNDACQAALNRYLAVRRPITGGTPTHCSCPLRTSGSAGPPFMPW